jgi:hypothetical protein
MVSREALTRIRNRMERILPQMRHCQQCRADAVGTGRAVALLRSARGVLAAAEMLAVGVGGALSGEEEIGCRSR